jgi:flavodoxin
MTTSVLSGLAAAYPVLAAPDSTMRKGSTALVAYFSRSGNTRVIAGTIQRAQNTMLFEIQPARPYPEDYLETVEQARRERDRGYRPPLKSTVPEFARYQTIYLGFPIWGGTVPPVIRAFLAAHDFKGKTIIPFITHGGYGIGNSLTVLAADIPGGRLLDRGLVMQADQERQTLERVTSWLGSLT